MFIKQESEIRAQLYRYRVTSRIDNNELKTMRRFGDLSSPPRDYYGGYPSLQQNEATSTAPSIAELLSMSQGASSDRSTGTDLEFQRLLSQHYQQQQQQGNQHYQMQHQQPDMTSLLLLQLQQQYAPQAQAQQGPSSSDYDAVLKQHEEQSMLSRIIAQQRQQTQHSSSTSDYEAAALRKRQEDQLLVSRVMAQQRQLDESGRDLNQSTLTQQQRNQMSQLNQYPPAFGNASNTSDSMIQGQQPPSFLSAGQEEIPGRGQLLPRMNALTSSALNNKVPGYLEAKVGEEVEVSLNKSTAKTEAEDASEDVSEEEEAEDTGREEDPNNDTFPHKLYRMVAEAEEEGNDNIVSFFAHGKAFAIHKPHDFVREIMPKYFTTSRMSSFQRQLNLYGFRRITEGQDKGGYFHDSFLKGRKSLIKQIKRKKTSVRAPPNFFAQSLASGGQPSASREMLATGGYNSQNSLLGASAASNGGGSGGDVNQALLLLMQQQQVQQQQQTDLMQQLLFRQQQGQGYDRRFG